jgi:hypothetical protein
MKLGELPAAPMLLKLPMRSKVKGGDPALCRTGTIIVMAPVDMSMDTGPA